MPWTVSFDRLIVASIILLITAQLVSAYDGLSMLTIDARKLKFAALTMGILFLATVAIHIFTIISTRWNINVAVLELMV